MGVEGQHAARARGALINRHVQERVCFGVWREPTYQAKCNMPYPYAARGREATRINMATSSCATYFVAPADYQPQAFPTVDELASMVDRIAGRIAEESLRSDPVPVSHQELVTQIDADLNQIELEDGLAGLVSTTPRLLGKRAMSSGCSPLVDPRLLWFGNIEKRVCQI